MSDHETAGNGGVDDDLSLPKGKLLSWDLDGSQQEYPRMAKSHKNTLVKKPFIVINHFGSKNFELTR